MKKNKMTFVSFARNSISISRPQRQYAIVRLI